MTKKEGPGERDDLEAMWCSLSKGNKRVITQVLGVRTPDGHSSAPCSGQCLPGSIVGLASELLASPLLGAVS